VPCTICERPIGVGETDFIITLKGAVSLRLDQACMDIWREQSEHPGQETTKPKGGAAGPPAWRQDVKVGRLEKVNQRIHRRIGRIMPLAADGDAATASRIARRRAVQCGP
jgi:hypothetical protein